MHTTSLLQPFTCIYPSAKCWEVVSHMKKQRYDYYSTLLPDNQLMVVGGQTEQGVTDIVEIASLL